MAVINLTEARIRGLEFGSGTWRDEQVKGLMVVCHKTTKTYAVQGDVRRNGRHIRTVRAKIDRCDRIGLREARSQAKALMSKIQSGIDPTANPDESGITLRKAMDVHLIDKPLRSRTKEGYEYHLEKYLKRFANRAVVDISRQEVRELYDKLRSKSGQTTAGSVMRTLRAVINTAMRLDETIAANPVAAIRIPTNNRRKVSALDIPKFFLEVETLNPIRRDLYMTMLLTGARRSSILQIRRNDVDLQNSILTFCHMKTGGPMIFPMGKKLSSILENRLAADEKIGSPWLWPSPGASSGHIVEPREKGRKLPSPHECRHHARTMFIASGVPYAESALLLGQQLPGASGGYVHPEHLVEHLRPHAQALEEYVFHRRSKSDCPA
ncbi:MAG: tyrosine-type recombinase/integrase [Parasphingorhabdus sp.]|uniref:tyrosine-type recombinase/integrase n=1 Tax=Parasphingorhabdus sp. TaxID=2709688 RepID=UPI00326F78ED